MKNIFAHSLLAFAIASSAPVSLHARDHKQYDSLAYYGTHTLTGLLSLIGVPACTLAGFAAGVPFEHSYAMKIDGVRYEIIPGITAALALIAGLTIMYKTPQWTNNYFFEKKPVRLTKQNILTFVSRLLLMPLFGFNFWASEYLGNNVVIEDEVA